MKKLILPFLILTGNLWADSFTFITNSPIEKEGPNEECSEIICQSLLDLIKNADSKIDFAIYGLRGQREILSALIDAEKRGVRVRGVIDKDTKGESYYSDTHLLEENLANIRSDYESDLRTAKKLGNKKYDKDKEKTCKGLAGVVANYQKECCYRPFGSDGPLQCFEGKGYASKEEILFRGDIMHNKFFIFDDKYIWTGSSNISDTGIGGYNANIVAILDSKYLADYYTIEFEQMYLAGLHHREKKKLKKQEISTYLNSSKVSLFFSPQGYAMYRGVIPLIRNSSESIDISIFFLTHNNISKELVKAHERGVKIRIILDSTAATNGYSKHNYLRDYGIPVKVESWGGKMHMKSAVIDKKHIIVGSMNWTSAGESKNDENTLIIQDAPKEAKELSLFFNKLWASIPEKWLEDDPVSESLDSGYSCFDKIDNDFDKVIDKKERDCR